MQVFEPEQLPLRILTVEKDQALEDFTAILMRTQAPNALVELRELTLNLKIVAKVSEHIVDELETIIELV